MSMRSLRNSALFDTVRNGANIRHNLDGWRLQKWLEVELDRTEGLWAAWWLELGADKDGWLIESSLSIDPEILFIGLPDRFAATTEELRDRLTEVVDELTGALEQNREFADQVESRRKVSRK